MYLPSNQVDIFLLWAVCICLCTGGYVSDFPLSFSRLHLYIKEEKEEEEEGCVCVCGWPYSCITQSPQLEKCYHSSTGRWKSKKSGRVGKRERVIRGQWGMREIERHQRHGFPPVHLSTQNKQASH